MSFTKIFGVTYENGHILLNTNQTLEDLFITCNHEMCHNSLNISSSLEENVCDTLDDNLIYAECLILLNK